MPRRTAGLRLLTTVASAAIGTKVSLAVAEDRIPAPTEPRQAEGGPDLTVTDTVYLDVAECSQALRPDRRLGDKSSLCDDPAPLGRIKIGLYGRLAPETVQTVLSMIRSGGYAGTTFSKVKTHPRRGFLAEPVVLVL